ncbi:hypothetical protein BH11PSE2_BH11PSE2_08530 [soil metagenome]
MTDWGPAPDDEDGRPQIWCKACGRPTLAGPPFCMVCGSESVQFTAPPQPPGSLVLEGVVVGFDMTGFTVRTDTSDVHIHTRSPGGQLDIDLGDRVSVFGGMHPSGGIACGSIHLVTDDGEFLREIADEPRVG